MSGSRARQTRVRLSALPQAWTWPPVSTSPAERLGLHPRFCDAIIAILRDGVNRGDAALDTSALIDMFLRK